MVNLQTIKTTIEDITKAINSVIQVDVTVIDAENHRIAATGQYTDQIGKKVAVNSVFYKALKTGKEFIVENPREDEYCQDCARKDICKEYAEVCCPIFLDDEVIGIIGLVAFDEFQKNEIVANKLNLLNFLKKMAELISTKIRESIHQDKLNQQAKEIEVLLNYIDDAIVSIGPSGKIIHLNCKAKNLLEAEENTLVQSIIPSFEVTKENLSDSFQLESNQGLKQLRYTTKSIIVDGVLEKVVISLREEKDLIQTMNEMVNTRQMISFYDIIGQSEAMLRTKKSAINASKSTSTVLIQGDSGTGKEMFARAIHNASSRRSAPFVAINCAAIPENLIESELFGYADGAFTGAIKGGKPGKFEIANKGTIFLDEIGDMPLHLQTKLLRVLQEREVERIGGKYSTSIDVRVIAATHQNLNAMIEKQMFRSDLFYRLNVFPILLPKLSERKKDIQPLAQFLLERYNQKLGKTIKRIEDSVLLYFENHSWDGNVREMENTIEYAVNMCNGDTITMENLPQHFSVTTEESKSDYIMRIDVLEKQEIQKALSKFPRTKEGINQVVEALGISRATLYRKIKLYDL